MMQGDFPPKIQFAFKETPIESDQRLGSCTRKTVKV